MPTPKKRGRFLLLVVAALVMCVVGIGVATTIAAFVIKDRREAVRQLQNVTGFADADREEWSGRWPKLDFPEHPSPGKSAVRVEYDEFEKFTSFNVSLNVAGYTIDFDTNETGKATTCDEPPFVVSVSVHRDSGVVGDLVFLADDEPIKAKTDPIAKAFNNARSKHLAIRTEDMLKIIAAPKVRCRIDYEETELTASDQARLRDFASLLKP